jgi:1-deoxy-D-xylulose-5-phosphate synthase
MKPVVAVYSTFLQRSYDQLIHDVALQELPVVICADRSGLVGRDGPTHHGVFDIAYSRTLPGFIVMAPKDGIELEEMLEKALEWDKPVFIRYPRSEAARIVSSDSCDPVETGKSETLRDGDDLILLALGSMVNTALKAADLLSGRGIEAEVINARFVKPLDREMLENIAHSGKRILILEEGIASGGFGSAVLEFFAREGLLRKDIQCFSLPDEFIQHGAREELLRMFHLTPDELAANIEGGLKG